MHLNAGLAAQGSPTRRCRGVDECERVGHGGADDNLIEGGEMKFVCKPGARNITVIFQPLLRYSADPHTECRAQNACGANAALFLADGFLMAKLSLCADGSLHLLQPAMQLMAALMTGAVGGCGTGTVRVRGSDVDSSGGGAAREGQWTDERREERKLDDRKRTEGLCHPALSPGVETKRTMSPH
ncbi:Exocyst complex component 4 [Liparis tanakae]|uniref:Exocyst complex component 4 n=1 Tax=Liparis tanakae TaxID=230148 RepID=A0A4Z2G8I3_9TELE|nr:Exocyst complex component 4 [Liparis tanakae]